MSRRWSIEDTFEGRTLRITQAPLWSGVLATVWPPVVLLASVAAVAWNTPKFSSYVGMIGILSFGFWRALHWPDRASEQLRILDDGRIERRSVGADARTAASMGVADDVTVRPTRTDAGWALLSLLDASHTPRVSIRSRGARMDFGLALSDIEAAALADALRASGPLAADRPPDAPVAAAVVDLESTDLRLEIRRLGKAPAKPVFRWWQRPVRKRRERTPRDPLALRRLGPLKRSAAAREIGILVLVAFAMGYPAFQAAHNLATGAAIAMTGALIVFPALVRLSQIAFAGTMEAQVQGTPARPGQETEVRLAQDRNGVVFDWLDVRLQCLRPIKTRERPLLGEQEADVVTWEGLYRPPAGRLSLGPDDAMIIRFTLPPDAPPTDPKARPACRWMLELEGMSPHGLYSERFEILVLPPVPAGRPRAEAATGLRA